MPGTASLFWARAGQQLAAMRPAVNPGQPGDAYKEF